VTESGAVALAWAGLGEESDLLWQCTSPLPLPGSAAAAHPSAASSGLVDAAAAAAAVAQTGAAVRVTAAAAAADGGGRGGVLVAYALSDQPAHVHVARIEGDPSFALAASGSDPVAAVTLPVVPVARVQAAAAVVVTGLAWSPGGGCLCVESASGSGSSLQLVAQQQGSSEWTIGAAQAVPTSSQQQHQQQEARSSSSSKKQGGARSVVWCPTGGAVLHASGGVFEINNSSSSISWGKQRCSFPPPTPNKQQHASQPSAQHQALPQPICLTVSPSGACACVVISEGGSSAAAEATTPQQQAAASAPAATPPASSAAALRLVVLALPEAPKPHRGADLAKLQAARLAWPLLHGSSTWDVQRALLSCCGFVGGHDSSSSTAAAGSISNGGGTIRDDSPGSSSGSASGGSVAFLGLAQALGLVDGLVHRMPSYQLPHYSTAWDMIKLGVVDALPGTLAEVSGCALLGGQGRGCVLLVTDCGC